MSKEKVKKNEKPREQKMIDGVGISFAISPEEAMKRIKQVENMPTVYFNHVRVAAGFLDIRLFMGEASVTPTGEPTFVEKMCVALTPEFAIQLLNLLAQQLGQYQVLFGNFRPQPDAIEFRKRLIAAQKALAGAPEPVLPTKNL